MADNTKPSFFRSVLAGIAGSIKGVLAGGLTGAVLGAAVGAIVGVATGGVGAIALAAFHGAVFTGIAMAGVGATAGTMTGVVKSREAAQPSANDVVNVAKATFAQGVAVGQQMSQEQTTFRDRIAKERATAGLQQIH